MSAPELLFVDDKGGALASLAASMAVARGAPARAATTTAPRPSREVSEVLAEIGVAHVVNARQGLSGAAEQDVELVVLGSSLVGGAAPTLDLRLYEGPPLTAFGEVDLERRAMARIARDRIERWLDQR